MTLTRQLPGTAKYKHRSPARACHVVGCVHPSHSGYSTNFGVSFCAIHWKRYLLLKLAEKYFPECLYSASKSLKYSRLQAWIDLAASASKETVNQAMRAFRDEMAALKIDQRML